MSVARARVGYQPSRGRIWTVSVPGEANSKPRGARITLTAGSLNGIWLVASNRRA